MASPTTYSSTRRRTAQPPFQTLDLLSDLIARLEHVNSQLESTRVDPPQSSRRAAHQHRTMNPEIKRALHTARKPLPLPRTILELHRLHAELGRLLEDLDESLATSAEDERAH